MQFIGRILTAMTGFAALGAAPVAHAQFATIIDVPPNLAPSIIGSNTQVNVFAGGAITGSVDAGLGNGTSSSIEVNVHGGSIASTFTANHGSTLNLFDGVAEGVVARSGSTVNVKGGVARISALDGSAVNASGGKIADGFSSLPASVLNFSGGILGEAAIGGSATIRGGTIRPELNAANGSQVRLIGGEFRLNGAPLPGLAAPGDQAALSFPEGSVLSGVLEDGLPFAFAYSAGDRFGTNSLTVAASPLPPIVPSSITVNEASALQGVRRDQRVTVAAGGVLPADFIAGRGSSITVLPGGRIGDWMEAVGAEIEVKGGEVGRSLSLYDGAKLVVQPGSILRTASAEDGSSIDVFGGAIQHVDVLRGGIARIHGGSLTVGFNVQRGGVIEFFDGAAGNIVRVGGVVNIHGGTIGDGFDARLGSVVNVLGGSMGSDFQAFSASNVRFRGGSLGDRLQTMSRSQVSFEGEQFRLNGVPIDGLSNLGDAVPINLSSSDVLSGVLEDGTPFAVAPSDADVIAGGSLKIVKSRAPGVGPAMIIVTGPSTLRGIRSGQSLLVEQGGELGNNFNADVGSALTIRAGGSTGNNLEAVGATVDVRGGTLGTNFDAFAGTTVYVHQGVIGSDFTAHRGSAVTIAGGTIVNSFFANAGSELNLIGREFRLNGELIADLSAGVTKTLTERSGVLSGVFADGSPFSLPFFLDAYPTFVNISAGAKLTVTLVPEPACGALILSACFLQFAFGKRIVKR
ncbi:hypothetical protein [Lacipirellula limnantheis]|uniref:Autotransporter-associated beta strand repeat protein n=1 Tax=Lacipirellula limnantheis TaxID=2528024 RepID=A0A517U593_9BACT|nr:hypothetical protein [Lacipirellula limnantheis]QDT75730.1 hypothetical protein I41_49720 [Lacipirellula limnantheis]